MKDIQGYEGLYAVTEDGQVWSYRANRFLKPYHEGHGYLKVSLCRSGQRQQFKVHRLVALAYLPNPDDLPQVNHLDENKENNCVSNLCWSSAKDNINYGGHNERSAKNRQRPVYCVELDKVFESGKAAAEELGLSAGNISACIHGRMQSTKGYHFTRVKRPRKLVEN